MMLRHFSRVLRWTRSVATLVTLVTLTLLGLVHALLPGPARALDAAPAGAPSPAGDVRRAGTIRVVPAARPRGPLQLQLSRDGYVGELLVVNDGKEPLVVSRVAVRGDAADPRAPAKLVARIDGAVLPLTLAPGASRKGVVQWIPDRGIRMRQLFAHVLVTSSDEQSGEVALGVRAQVPGLLGPLESHVLSLLVGLPLLGAIVTLLLRVVGRSSDRVSHLVAVSCLALQAALAAYVYRGFAPEVSRLDGNDGLQFIEHATVMRGVAAEVFLGVDGTGAAALLITALVALFALLPERTVPRAAAGYHATYLVLSSSIAGALAAMDGLLFVVFVGAAITSSVLLVGAWGGAGRRDAAMRLSILGGIAVVALLLAVASIARHGDPTFLVDGTKTSVTFSLPELSRISLGTKGATLFGLSLVKVAFVLVLLASVVMLGAFPLHGWLTAVLVEAPTASGALVVAGLPAIGACALLRVGCAVLPEGMRWASGVVVALGAVTAAYGALGAFVQTDLRRLSAYATLGQVGFVLLGAGSLTPQGIAGAMVLAGTRGLASALFLVLASAIEERARTRDLARFTGLARQMPGWAAALAAAAIAQGGLLGFAGAWGPMLALLGALPNYPPLALIAALALVVAAAAHARVLARVLFGDVAPDWARSPLLEAFGGRFPDLTAREWLTVAPLAAIVLLLGVWPAPVFASTTGTTRDLTNAVSPPGPDQIALAE